MPQEIRVLKCFTCDLFQTDIVKKSNKWQCKVCCTKQSVRREYGRGSGPVCRAKVQELNKQHGEEQRVQNNSLLEVFHSTDEIDCDWNTIDAVEENACEKQREYEQQNYNEEHVIGNENQQLFKYSNTRKWCEPLAEGSNATNNVKKSKWESFI